MKNILIAISLCALVLSASAQLQTDNALPNLTQSDFTVVERNSVTVPSNTFGMLKQMTISQPMLMSFLVLP